MVSNLDPRNSSQQREAVRQGLPPLFPFTNLTRGLAARRLFRVTPCHEENTIYKHPCLLRGSNPGPKNRANSHDVLCGLSLTNNIRDQTFSEIWILTYSPSFIQHLSNWPSIGDSTSRSIPHPFQQLADRHPIHLQWIPSHVGLPGNEVVDDLVKAATSDSVDPEDHMVLTSTEIYSRAKE
ncbi:RNase H domain-containing protein [Trichonephila clavipes]|nr:RNase H domain-containing protein [Trichonephila clavipes]